MNFSDQVILILSEALIAGFLGIAQGVSEFLPISSTAHTRIFSALIFDGRDIGLATSNFIQLASVLAIITYFWRDLKLYANRLLEITWDKDQRQVFYEHLQVWLRFPSKQELQRDPALDAELQKLQNLKQFQLDITICQLAAGTLPILILGALLYNFASSSRNLNEIAIFLAIGSLLMMFAEWIHEKVKTFPKNKIISTPEIILIGIFQVLAIFPGMSRSGSTVSGALMLGRNRSQSVNFSFLLAIPAVLLAGLKDTVDLIMAFLRGGISLTPTENVWDSTGQVNLAISSLLVAFVVTYIASYVSLRWLLKYLSKNKFTPFIIYRLIASLFIVFFLVS